MSAESRDTRDVKQSDNKPIALGQIHADGHGYHGQEMFREIQGKCMQTRLAYVGIHVGMDELG